MATQTRLITQRSAKFHSATLKAYIVMVFCSLVLLSAFSSYAALVGNGLPLNGLPLNGLYINGMPINGLYINGMPINGLAPHATTLQREPLPAGPQESLPFKGLSQRALGKHQPPSCKGTLCRP